MVEVVLLGHAGNTARVGYENKTYIVNKDHLVLIDGHYEIHSKYLNLISQERSWR